MKVQDVVTGKTVKINKRLTVGIVNESSAQVHLQAVRTRKNPDKEPREVDFTVSWDDYFRLYKKCRFDAMHVGF